MKKMGARCLWSLMGMMSLSAMAQAAGPTADATATARDDDALSFLFDETGAAPAPIEEPAEEASATAPATTPTDGSQESPDGTIADDAAEPETLAEIPVVPLNGEPLPSSPAAAPPRSAQLEEIVVTATKREQPLREIPSSMEVMGGEKLEELGLRKVKDIFALVPGINMQDEMAGIQRKVSVRGVGPDSGTNQTVGSVLGDIPISDPYGSATIVDPNPWDMRTVEVLKGPQGSLFGATSLAGLIRYVPNSPELGQWQGKAFYEHVSVDRGGNAPTYGAALNVPFGETFAMRASGIYQELPGVIDVDNPARREKDVDTGVSWNGRAMALWQPTERLTLNALYMQEERSADDINLVTFADGTYTRKDAPQASPSENTFRLVTLDVRYEFDWATLAWIGGYLEKESFNRVDTSYLIQPLARLGVSFLHAQREVETEGVMQELRLMSPNDGALTWLGGLYFSSYQQKSRSDLFVPGLTLPPLLVALLPEALRPLFTEDGVSLSSTGYDPLKATEYALFGEASYDVTDSLRVTLGSRLYQTEVKGTFMAAGLSGGNNGATPGSTEEGWSPKLALTYRPTDDVLFYGTVSRGFQFGGFNLPTVSSAEIPLTFKSSMLWNYEVGVRTDWLDRTMRFDVTAFFLDWKNPQLKQLDASGVNGWVENVGGTHNIGVEATFRWLTPLDGLTIEQTASYIEARTTEPFDDSSGDEVPKGTLMPSSPLVQAVTSLSYAKPFGVFMTQATLINSLQGKSWTDITHETEVGDFSLLSFNFNISRTDLRWVPSVSLSVNNITNVQKVVAGFGGDNAGDGLADALAATSSYVYTLPRSVVLRLSAEF